MEELTSTYLLLKVDYATFKYGIFHIHGTFSYLLASLLAYNSLFCIYSMIQAFNNWAEITKSKRNSDSNKALTNLNGFASY